MLTFLKARRGSPRVMVKNFKEESSSKNMKEKGIRLKCISNTRRKELRSEEMIWNKAGESILSLGILSPRTPAGRYWIIVHHCSRKKIPELSFIEFD